MTFFNAIVLGIVEGLTEFIPVSSSGHLILTHTLLGDGGGNLAFDAIIQMGTIFAVLVYFWKDLWNIFLTFCRMLTGRTILDGEKTRVWAIALGTIPAVIFGLLLQTHMETVFRDTRLVAFALLGGSILMYCSDRFYRGLASNKVLTVRSGIVIGFYQCLALIPGVSRSGATISGGLFQGLSREEATRFSFLLSFPIIVGAGLKEFFGLVKIGLVFSAPLLVSTIVAFGVGMWSIGFLIKYLKNHTLTLFVWYRVLVAVLILLFV